MLKRKTLMHVAKVRCLHFIGFNPAYFFLDIDFGPKEWEEGFLHVGQTILAAINFPISRNLWIWPRDHILGLCIETYVQGCMTGRLDSGSSLLFWKVQVVLMWQLLGIFVYFLRQCSKKGRAGERKSTSSMLLFQTGCITLRIQKLLCTTIRVQTFL